MRGVGDADHVIMQMETRGGFAEDGTVGLLDAGDLIRAERGRAADGGVDEGELLSAEAGCRKIGGVGDAKSIHGFEGGYEAADFLFHNNIHFMIVISPSQRDTKDEGDYSEATGKFNPFFDRINRIDRIWLALPLIL
jgi:hypothetical protein